MLLEGFVRFVKLSRFALGGLVALAMFPVVSAAQSDAEPGSLVGQVPTYVMVVDIDEVVQNSTALADLQTRVKSLADFWEAGLNQARERLAEQNQLIDEVFADDAEGAAEQRVQIQEGLAQLSAEVAGRERELSQINVRALRFIRQEVSAVAMVVAQERGANVVINSGQTILVQSGFDLTEEVLRRLNQSYPQVQPIIEDIEAKLSESAQ